MAEANAATVLYRDLSRHGRSAQKARICVGEGIRTVPSQTGSNTVANLGEGSLELSCQREYCGLAIEVDRGKSVAVADRGSALLLALLDRKHVLAVGRRTERESERTGAMATISWSHESQSQHVGRTLHRARSGRHAVRSRYSYASACEVSHSTYATRTRAQRSPVSPAADLLSGSPTEQRTVRLWTGEGKSSWASSGSESADSCERVRRIGPCAPTQVAIRKTYRGIRIVRLVLVLRLAVGAARRRHRRRVHKRCGPNRRKAATRVSGDERRERQYTDAAGVSVAQTDRQTVVARQYRSR